MYTYNRRQWENLDLHTTVCIYRYYPCKGSDVMVSPCIMTSMRTSAYLADMFGVVNLQHQGGKQTGTAVTWMATHDHRASCWLARSARPFRSGGQLEGVATGPQGPEQTKAHYPE